MFAVSSFVAFVRFEVPVLKIRPSHRLGVHGASPPFTQHVVPNEITISDSRIGSYRILLPSCDPKGMGLR